MNYRIDQIEGIGPAYAARLQAINIKTTDDLLDRCATPRGREEVAELSDIPRQTITRWANHADLFRIRGVAGQFAELLEAAGVDTVKELRHRVPENLHSKMVEINEARNLTNRVPSVKEITHMVEQARELEPRITY